jgi:hypothetical protein
MIMYNYITQAEADRIREILLYTYLYKEITLEVGDFRLNAYDVSETHETEHVHSLYEMQEFYLLGKGNEFGVIEYKQKKYNAFVNVGEWGYDTRLRNAHITLGSNKFHDYCFQLELSQALKDENYIYLLKNVTDLSGPGAICRLYRGLKNNRAEKLKRQDMFINRLGKQVLRYEHKDWSVISKLRRKDLYDETKADQIFYDLIHDMFFVMLLTEDISKKE